MQLEHLHSSTYCIGGSNAPPVILAATESWNGTSWTEVSMI